MDAQDTLKIDKDCCITPDWMRNYIKVILRVCELFKIKVKLIQVCRSKRKGHHFYITIDPPVDAEFGNQLEFLLGDDAVRVSLNRARVRSGLPRASKLFEEVGCRLRTIYGNSQHSVSSRRFKLS